MPIRAQWVWLVAFVVQCAALGIHVLAGEPHGMYAQAASVLVMAGAVVTRMTSVWRRHRELKHTLASRERAFSTFVAQTLNRQDGESS